MKRPNGVIVDAQSAITGSSPLKAICDVPPCKVSECDYFHRDSRGSSDFIDCEHAITASSHETDKILSASACLNGVQAIIDDLKDRLLGEKGTDHHREDDGVDVNAGSCNPSSPFVIADVVDIDVDDNCSSSPSSDSKNLICDEDMDKEEVKNPTTAGHKEKTGSLLLSTHKRIRIEKDIKGLMSELCRHEAALILLKKLRVSQLMYFGAGECKFRTSSSAGSYGRTNHPNNQSPMMNVSRRDGNPENDQNIAPRHYIERMGLDADSRLTHGSFDRPLGQTDRHRAPGSTSSNWSKGVSSHGRNGTIQATQRFSPHQQVSSRGIAGCINPGHYPMDRNIQLMSLLTENVQRSVYELLDTFRFYTDLSLSAKISKPLPDNVQSEPKTMSSFLAFMPNNAVNFIPSTVNPEFTMLVGLEVICNRLEKRVVISTKQSNDPAQISSKFDAACPPLDANCDSSGHNDTSDKLEKPEHSSSKDEKHTTTAINRCSKCKTYSSPYFFDLTDSPEEHGISDAKALKYPLCCGNCLRALRLEQLSNVQFRKYQDILDNHRAMEKSEVSKPIKQTRQSAEKRPAELRQEEFKYKTRSPQAYHHNPSQHSDYNIEHASGMQNHQLQEQITPSGSIDMKVRQTNVANSAAASVIPHLPFPPPPHMTPEQFQQCHTEWLRQAALLQSHGGTNPSDNLLLGSHFPPGAQPLLSNAVVAAAALAAMTATHRQGPGINAPASINPFPIMSTTASAANSFNRRETSALAEPPVHQTEPRNQGHQFDDDCGVALNLTTRSDKLGNAKHIFSD